MHKLLISVVTVTLNCADDAVATAHSVLAQDFANYEYFIKDGGSTDGTVERLRELGVQVQVEPDSGIYEAMNQALPGCRGDYVCFLNAGDLFFAGDTLTRVAEQLQRHKYPQFAFGDICSFTQNPVSGESPRGIQYPDHLSRFYLYRKMICHQSWFVHKSLLLQENGFNTKFHLAADYYFLLKMILKYQIDYVHIPLKVITYKGGGVTETNSLLAINEKREIQKIYYSIMERIFYKSLYNTVWFLSKQLIYRLYSCIPARLKERAAGW